MLISRRGLIGGMAGLLAAPAIVRASSLMPVKAVEAVEYLPCDLRPGAVNVVYGVFRVSYGEMSWICWEPTARRS